MPKSSRLPANEKALRRATIDARRLKHTGKPMSLAPEAAALLLGGSTSYRPFGGGKYIPAGRLRNVPLTNR